VSLFQRYEWFTKYSGDTMDLYGRTTNGLDLENLRHYQIDLSAQHFNASGLRLGYTQSLGQFAFYAAGSLLSGSDMMAGTISGDALLNSTCGDSFDCYTGDLELDYFYSEDAIFGRKTSKPRSVYGYTFDVGASWTNERWHVSGFIQDVFSEIAWENAPYTTANATTATVEEKNGKVKLNPVITGYEGNDYFLQSLPKKYSSTIAFAVTPRSTVHIDGFHSYGATVGNIGYLFAKHQMLWGAKYYPLQQVLGASIAHKYFSISAAANPFDLNSSEIIELSASFRYPF
jgi:hypothetical protein